MAEAQALLGAHWVAPDISTAEHVAAALASRDAEIARLRERVAEVEGERDHARTALSIAKENTNNALTRAERAERIAADQERSCTRMEALLLAAGERAATAERGLAAIVVDLKRRLGAAFGAAVEHEHTIEIDARAAYELQAIMADYTAGAALSALLADAEANGRREERADVVRFLLTQAHKAGPSEFDTTVDATLLGIAGEALLKSQASFIANAAHLPPERPTVAKEGGS
jgi:hypothetical protein